jgi:ribose transport system ATP-binding protein
MDEPTSSLTLTETDRLLAVIADLRANGVGIIFISHRLNEVTACADRVVVLRDGRKVAELGKTEISPDAMVRHMIGRDLKSVYRPPNAAPGAPILEIRGARTPAHPDPGIDLAVQRGEILGLAGLIGAGRTELARAVFGIEPLTAGSVRLEGTDLAIRSPRDAIAQGLYLVPEDRKGSGVVLELPIAQNISLPQLADLARYRLVDRAAEATLAETQAERLRIRAPDVGVAVGSLSGGNQQKVVLAKWLSMSPKAIIFDEPTRGIDVGAKQEIYDMLRVLADSGVAILMISSDMEEVIGVSDRIAVMHEGRISGTLDRADFSEAAVLRLAVGHVH